MTLSFIHPGILFLLLLLPLLWAFSLIAQARQRTNQTRARHWPSHFHPHMLASLTLRMIILIALVLALAGTQLVQQSTNLTVVFLIDGSDSVTPAQREWAIDYINQTLATKQTEDRAAIVVFGKNALVEYTPTSLDQLSRLTSLPVGSRTNIQEAIQLGMALLPANTQKRLILLSDGKETAGHALEAARLATARNVPLDTIPLPSEQGPDVIVRSLDAPGTARENQPLTLQAHITSSFATSGQLQILTGGELVETRTLDIPAGSLEITIDIPGSKAGFLRHEVRLEAQGDTRSVNNRAAAFTMIQGPPRVLLVATDPAHATPLQNVLEATNARVELVPPERVPTTQEQLRAYAAVVLVNVLAHEVPRYVVEALPVYVREQGGTLAMIGGRESFGAGGWRRSPIAEVLPVELERKDKLSRPDLGLVLVIDRSGSMVESAGIARTKLDLAKEAVYQATLGLESNDQIGIIAFDTLASWVLPIQTLPSLIDIEQALSQFFADGGTNIRSGIEPAAQALRGLNAKVKHVILLTDGQANSNYADLITRMRESGITITVVSIGRGANPELAQIAEIGGGRYYRVEQLSDVPRIFLSETVIVVGRDIVEEPFIPVATLQAPIVRGLGALPTLYGYNVTQPRPAARTILTTPDAKPLLAQGQYGLGQGIAWTSDLKGQWARDWITWDNFPRFGSSLLDMMLPPEQTDGLALESQVQADRAILNLTVPNTRNTRNGVRIKGRLLGPNDKGQSLGFVQIGANQYRATVPVDVPGAYLSQVSVIDSAGQPLGTSSNGLVVSYSPEYSEQHSNPQLLSELAAATRGRQSPAPAEAFTSPHQSVGVVQEVSLPLLWLALVLLPFDIALRRLLLRKSDLRALRDRLRQPFRPHTAPSNKADTTMARLMAAKERAHQRTNPKEEPPQSGEQA